MRAALGAANCLKLLQVRLRAGDRTHLDHRFALDGDRVGIVGLDQQRLVRHPDRLAEQMLLLGDASDVDKGAAVARIDGKRGLEHVFGLLELARRNQRLALMLQLDRLGQDLVVGALAGDRRGKRQRRQSRSAARRDKERINLSTPSARLAWSPKPRDEKAIGAVVAGRQQPAGAVRTPGGNGRFLTNPR